MMLAASKSVAVQAVDQQQLSRIYAAGCNMNMHEAWPVPGKVSW